MFSKLKPNYVYRDITEDIADHDDDYEAEEWNYDGRDVFRGCADPTYEWDVYRLYDDNSRCVGIAEHEDGLFYALWFYDSPFSLLFQEPDWKPRDATIWSVLSNEAYQDCLDDDFKSLIEWCLPTKVRLVTPEILIKMPFVYTCEICGKMSLSAMSGCSQLKKSSYLTPDHSVLFIDNSFVLYTPPTDSQVWSIVRPEPDENDQPSVEQPEQVLIPDEPVLPEPQDNHHHQLESQSESEQELPHHQE